MPKRYPEEFKRDVVAVVTSRMMESRSTRAALAWWRLCREFVHHDIRRRASSLPFATSSEVLNQLEVQLLVRRRRTIDLSRRRVCGPR